MVSENKKQYNAEAKLPRAVLAEYNAEAKLPRACSPRKRAYMKRYNKRPEVKARKAAYMRRVRSVADQAAARDLVSFLIDMGYSDMAFDYAQERAPEMLVVAKNKARAKLRK